jgi:hypothetical protein
MNAQSGVLRRALAVALGLLVFGSAWGAGWSSLAGTYVGTWKSADTDGSHYSGTATVKIVGGSGNKLKLTLKTAFLGNSINGTAKAKPSGAMSVTVTNAVLGTATGTGKAIAAGKNGRLTGNGPLFQIGTATLNAKVHGTAARLTANGTLEREFFGVKQTLTFSFSGKKK